ncbi:MAG: DUF6691 family protein [Burkholderiales bacterium]
MTPLTAFASGLVFGVGLLVAGMADPAKVISFLDVAGRFDPSLAVVMASALPVAALAYAIANRRRSTLAGLAFEIPTSRALDRRLLAGAVVFGIGWGIAGVCPGPGFVLLGAGRVEGVVFVAFMAIGMAAFEAFERRRAARLAPVAADA